jgi:peptidyl-prolyl cis-trans isomerase D
MLRTMRTDLQALVKTFMWAAVIALVGTTFLVWGVRSGSDSDGVDTVAKVGKEYIHADEYMRAYEQSMEYMRQLFRDKMDPQMLKSLNLRLRVLDEMINRRLLLREAQNLDIKVSHLELADKIKTYEAFKDKGAFSRERYLQILKINRLTPERFENQQREELLLKKMEAFLEDQARVSEAEVEEQYRRTQERMKVEYVFFPASLNMEGAVSEEEVKKYYQEHKDNYLDKERADFQMVLLPVRNLVRARHILFKVDTPPRPGQEQAAGKLAAETLKKIKEGGNFETLARELSQDPGSAAEGGDLGYFPSGRMVKPFEDAAFALKPGEVSGIVQSPYGYHIIKVEDIINSPVGLIEDPADAQAAARKRAEELQKRAKSKGMEKAAEALGLKVKAVKDFAPGDKLPFFGFAPIVERTVFALKKGEVSRAVQGPLGIYIVKLLDKKEAQPLAYEKAVVEVKKDINRQKALEAAKTRAQGVTAKIASPGLWNQILRAEKLAATKTDFFTRDGYLSGISNPEGFYRAAFALKKGEISSPLRSPEGYYLIKVVERQDMDQEKFQKEKADLLRNQLAQKKEKIKRSYLEALRKKAKVEIYEDRIPVTEG